jgi:hypothetical protein
VLDLRLSNILFGDLKGAILGSEGFCGGARRVGVGRAGTARARRDHRRTPDGNSGSSRRGEMTTLAPSPLRLPPKGMESADHYRAFRTCRGADGREWARTRRLDAVALRRAESCQLAVRRLAAPSLVRRRNRMGTPASSAAVMKACP